MTAPAHRLQVRIRIYCGDEIAIGPGKADLLDTIGETGSISGAARKLGMSYRRAWLLVDTMNRCWQEPLVTTANGGGAVLSQFGRDALAAYRAMQVSAGSAADGPGWMALQGQLLPAPRAHQARQTD